MRTARANGVSVAALARRFGAHRGTVWAKTRLASISVRMFEGYSRIE